MFPRFSVRKPFTIFVAVAIVLIFGGVSLSKMTPDLFPNINTPYVIVMTADPGASAEEAESELTDPVEQQLATLPNIKNINSVSADNYSMVTLEFTDKVNMDAISVDIRDKLDQIRDQLPESAASPVVMKINMDMMPVVVAAVSMKDKSPAEVSSFTRDKLMTPLEGTEGVASVTSMGMIDDGLQVVLSREAIDDLNQRVEDAVNAQVDDGKSKARSGLNKARSGKDKIEDGKDQIVQGQKDATEQIAESKKEILKQKAAMEVERDTLIAAKEAAEEELKALPDLQKLEETVTPMLESGDPDMIADARDMLAGAGFQSIEELSAAIDHLMQIDMDEIDQGIKDIEDGIRQMDQALQDIEDQEQALNFSLSTNYSDLAAAESALSTTIAQLEQTMKEIEDSREAALAGADLDNIVTMENVKSILQAQNFSMPAGYVTDEDAEILVSVGDKIESAQEMENLILFDLDIDGLDPIRVRDVATVLPAAQDSDTYARINGDNGVLLSFTKQSTYATANVADNVREQFEKLEKRYDGLSFTPLVDQGEYIHVVINSVLRNLILGGILAILILMFFLRDIRPTLITAVSIPVSVVFALALMYFSGVTLNMISLSGLAIGVGMLVDNSIVVIENIYRLRSMGYSLVQSAVSGAVQVGGAITASTLTTICVFAPIVFVEGMTRDIFIDLALTVAYSLLASLIIALTLVPAMAKGMLVRDPRNTVLGQGGRTVTRYRNASAWALSHKKWIIIGAVVLLLGSSGLLLTRGFEYMPAMSTTEISAQIQMPEDATLGDTARVNDDIMKEIRRIDGVETVGAMLASDTIGVMGMSSSEQDVTQTSMYIVLEDGRADQAPRVAKRLDMLAKKHDCEIETTADMDMASYTGVSDLSLTLYAEDLDQLRESAQRIENRLRKVKALEDVSDIRKKETEELHISIDKNLAMTEGLTVAQVYQQIAAKLKKEDAATTLDQDGTTVGVTLENSTAGFPRDELKDIKLTVEKKDGKKEEVSLSKIAEIEKDASLTEISHEGQNRNITVSASIRDGYNVTRVSDSVQKMIRDEDLLGKGVTLQSNGQDEEIMDAMRQLLLMMIVGFLLVYLIMVAQFQSIRSPLIVIFSVPLAFTGGMIALLITGQVMSVVSMFGMVMLMGIVVNNAIVLVDCINRFRLEGMEMEEAIIQGGAVRMRPVIMTAATTVLGLLPLALGFGQGAEMVQPLAIVCIGGLIFATATTLLVIPVMYRLIGRKHMEKIKDEELEIINV